MEYLKAFTIGQNKTKKTKCESCQKKLRYIRQLEKKLDLAFEALEVYAYDPDYDVRVSIDHATAKKALRRIEY